MASVIDVFCGAGGLTHGFVRRGFNVVAGVDNDPDCQYPFERNNPDARFILKSVSDLHADELNDLFVTDQPKILVGCAPCQPFSTYTHKLKYADKWQLVNRFAELILEVEPEIFSMENVPALVKYKRGQVFNEFIDMLEPHYEIAQEVVSATDYGVPQRRKRLVVLGSRLGPIQMIEPTHGCAQHRTVENAIGDLPPIAAGEVSIEDPLHRAAGLSPVNLERIRQSIPGGTWRDWDEDLRTKCHRKSTGKTFASVYGRMRADRPSPTITTQAFGFGTGRFGHPNQDRALSLREMALLQTFPPDYGFLDLDNTHFSFRRAGKLIGNAVPVLLAERIAESIERHLENDGYST